MMAGDVVGLIDVLGIGAANVFGISIGGMIAQEFALSYPKYLKNFILGCTSCGGPKAVQISPDAELSAIENDEHAFITDSGDESAMIMLQFLKKHSKHW